VLTGEFAGQWWVPGARRKQFGGVLTLVRGDQPTLHVMGVMTDLQQRLGALAVEHPVIHGTTATGQPITLMRAYESGGKMNLLAPDAGDTMISAPRAYIGGHFKSEEAATFRSVAFGLSWLSSWFPAPLIDRDIGFERDRMTRAVLTFTPQPDVEIKLPFGSLSLKYDFTATGNLRTDAHFVQRAWIVANARQKHPLDWWLKTVVRPMRHLLTLATERPTEVTTLYLRPRPDTSEDQVEIVWAIDVSQEDPERDLHAGQVLFWYGDISDRFEAAMRSWFGAVETLDSVFNQYFATFNTKRSYVENRLLMTVQAAEAYHRERIGGTDAPDDVHRERIEQALRGVEGKHVAWVKQRLQNEPSLFQRIVELCAEVPEVTKLMVGGDSDGFARAVRDARNYRTHMDPRRRVPGTNLTLVQLAAQLGVILEAVVLHRELGFDSADIATRIERASRMRHVAVAAARGDA
jgi:hypothetical protein